MPVHAVDFIIDAARRYTGLTILALGPLTNLALALRREPRLAQQVAGICLMGGSLDRGNVTPFAEFNILCDPEAAHVVFTSGIPIKMCGLNLTRQATISVEDCRAFRSIGNRTGSVIADLMECYCSILGRVSGVPLASLHDVCAAAWLIDPTLITAWPLHVTIELTGTHTYGMTVCDYRHLRGPQGDLTREVGTSRGEPPNAEVALALHQPRFMRLLLDTLATYP
jgi:pyrimidine-specific ribonucleoside hydrolase